MKKLFFTFIMPLVLFIILSACVTTSERQYACQTIANELDRTKKWSEGCMSDDEIYTDGYYDLAMNSTPEELCNAEVTAATQFNKNLLGKAVTDRKIDCKPIRIANLKDFVKKASNSNLCEMWDSRATEQAYREIINREVKNRDVDCPAMLALILQQQQSQMQLSVVK
jgi:hypothetical protein